MRNYAIVPSPGCYGSGDIVRPVTVLSDSKKAKQLAARMTKHHQAEMRQHGGTSGGYRVVPVEAKSRREICWLGHELNLIMS